MAKKESPKKKVQRFIDKLEKSSLKQYMKFQSEQEKLEVILNFSEIVGIPTSKLNILLSKLKVSSKKKDER